MAKKKSGGPPLAVLKQGIQQANWKKVCEAYEGLTGERLNAPVAVQTVAETPVFFNSFVDRVDVEDHETVNDQDKKKMLKRVKTKPLRQEFTPVEVECAACHETETVSPSFVPAIGKYYCNECAANNRRSV